MSFIYFHIILVIFPMIIWINFNSTIYSLIFGFIYFSFSIISNFYFCYFMKWIFKFVILYLILAIIYHFVLSPFLHVSAEMRYVMSYFLYIQFVICIAWSGIEALKYLLAIWVKFPFFHLQLQKSPLKYQFSCISIEKNHWQKNRWRFNYPKQNLQSVSKIAQLLSGKCIIVLTAYLLYYPKCMHCNTHKQTSSKHTNTHSLVIDIHTRYCNIYTHCRVKFSHRLWF